MTRARPRGDAPGQTTALGPIGRRRAALAEARAGQRPRFNTGLVSVAALLVVTIALSALPAAATIDSPGGPPAGAQEMAGAAATAPPESAMAEMPAPPAAALADGTSAANAGLGRPYAGDAVLLWQVPRNRARVFATPEPAARAVLVGEPPTAPPTATPTLPPTPKPTAVPTRRPTAVPTARPTAQPTPKPTRAPTARPTRAATNAGAAGCGDCAFSGSFVWPVPGGELSQGYHAGHEAIDIYAPIGTPVLAAASGEVIFAGWKDNGGGWQVWLSHGDLVTTYNHMSSVAVGPGAWVGAGQLVGRLGATGWATGPHLHFEAWIGIPWRGGYPVSPLRYL